MTPSSPSPLLGTDLFPDYRPSTLIELPRLAQLAGVGRVFVKAENERPLGNFKVLGGMHAGLSALARATGVATLQELSKNTPQAKALPRLICASAGNHGLAVAAAARHAGTHVSIYLPVGVSQTRAARIQAQGADIVWVEGTYDDAVLSAAAAATRGEGLLVPDTSDDPDDMVVRDVMAGYGLLTRELVAQLRDQVQDQPSHLFVQAGVGGLAAAMAQGLCHAMRERRTLLVVEPAAAACVARALEQAHPHPVRIEGALHTVAEMLSCGLASAPALPILLEHHAQSVLVDETRLQAAVGILSAAGGPQTTPSGATGLAGLLHVAADPLLRAKHHLDTSSSVLLIVTEGLAKR